MSWRLTPEFKNRLVGLAFRDGEGGPGKVYGDRAKLIERDPSKR